ncbi:hypothetical protein [Pseudomonas sp. L1(2025)]|uniref:hypothetical protein n=1 Tax=Pseudomonas sp. L1(2025) TaxID=3449429 RepID=UPI003F6900B5
MTHTISPGLKPLPVPPNYMRVAEQNQLREMSAPMGRPAGDHRSAERIIEQSSVTRRFLESRDHYEIGDDLKKQVGDWTDANPDLEARANAAYDLDKVLRFIDNVDYRTLNGSESRNGHVDGFCLSGYGSTINSEASLLRQFSRYGYETLRYLPT